VVGLRRIVVARVEQVFPSAARALASKLGNVIALVVAQPAMGWIVTPASF